MDSIGVRELRQNASVYLGRVKDGESIEVTERGVPIAILSPAPSLSLFDRLVAEGAITPARGELSTWLRDNPVRSRPAGNLSEKLQQSRDEDDR
jgi:prevent-host-death family protein